MIPTDLWFLLPAPPRRAALLGVDRRWAESLAAFGAELVEPGDGPDAVVTVPARLEEALRSGAGAVVLAGAARRAVRRVGLAAALYSASPRLDGARSFAPARARPVAAGRLVTVVARERPVPFLLAALDDSPGSWTLRVAAPGASGRSAFVLAAPSGGGPGTILKFSRTAAGADGVAHERAGLEVAASAGEVVARHAPALLGHVEVEGFAGTLETAADGVPLSAHLASRRSREDRLRAVRRVADWLVDVAASTAAPRETLAPARAWLRDGAVALAGQHGAPADLADRVPGVGAVLQHNDLWSGNVLVDGDSFTAVDWQLARRHGFPLFDGLYFLADALARLDGVTALDDRLGHFVRLFRGELPSSAVARDWTLRAAAQAGMASEDLGPLATLCWLDKGFLPWRADEAAAPAELKGRMAVAWLREPGLGLGWSPAAL